jgi:hypothetical protein
VGRTAEYVEAAAGFNWSESGSMECENHAVPPTPAHGSRDETPGEPCTSAESP